MFDLKICLRNGYREWSVNVHDDVKNVFFKNNRRSRPSRDSKIMFYKKKFFFLKKKYI